MTGALLYFAYGSNMLRQRLVRRCPSASAVGAFTLPGYGIDFSKYGRDGSGKATIFAAPSDIVTGVIFRLDRAEIALLDQAEGLGRGYDRLDAVTVMPLDGKAPVQAMTYSAEAVYRDETLQPFDWYRALVLAGAQQNSLPEQYIARLAGQTSVVDPTPMRPSCLEALDVLREAGFDENGNRSA